MVAMIVGKLRLEGSYDSARAIKYGLRDLRREAKLSDYSNTRTKNLFESIQYLLFNLHPNLLIQPHIT
jgi:hypothetical protein